MTRTKSVVGSGSVIKMAYEVPAKLVKASKELFRAIIVAAGGPSAVANSLDWDRQYITQYIRYGYVPMTRTYDVAKLLGISPFALSYFKFLEALGEDELPSFKKVVTETAILPAEKAKILDILK